MKVTRIIPYVLLAVLPYLTGCDGCTVADDPLVYTDAEIDKQWEKYGAGRKAEPVGNPKKDLEAKTK